MTPSAAGKGIDHRESKAKFDPEWDEYENAPHNKKRIEKMRAKHLRDARRMRGKQ